MKNDFYKNILENLYEGIYYVDRDRVITYWNKAAERITGYKSKDVVGLKCSDNILRHIDYNGIELCIQGCPLKSVIEDGRTREMAVYLHHQEGHRVPVSVRGTPIYDDNDQITGAVEIFTDNSNRDDLLKELELLKNEILTDPLTQIGNRRFAEMRFKDRFEAYTESKISFSLFMLDIDNFKKFNDIYGHNVGDRVLKMVAKTISNVVRKLDVVIRWGGEEFIIIVPNVEFKVFSDIGERIRMFIEKSWLQENDEILKVTVSIGGTTVKDGDDTKSLVERADENMYRSKKEGKNRITIN